MGDPAGIGPEIVIKALSELAVYEACVPVVIGDAGVLAKAPGWHGREPRLEKVERVEDARPEPGVLYVFDLDNVPPSVQQGVVSAESGRASVEYLNRAIALGLAGGIEAAVFGPLNKAAIKKAGFQYPDEYEYLADVSKSKDYTVMTVSPHFTLATVVMHIAMKDMPAMVTRESVLATIRRGQAVAKSNGIAHPRIGVAGLNPHAGEGDTLGTEERDAIRPAVEAAISEGIDAHGPFPADSFFMTVKDPVYDVYVGMYHDQGRIAMKLLDFGRASTMAEGLPVLFCTVAHGTAYDIAGKGIARHENMRDTILLAARRAVARRAEA